MTSRPDIRLAFPHVIVERGITEPDAPYLCEVSGPEHSYGSVLHQSLRLAQTLKSAGVRPGDRVASMIPTSADSVIVMTATALLGAIHVPVNTAYIGHMLEHALTLTAPTVLIIEGDLTDRTDEIAVLGDLQVLVRDGSLDSMLATETMAMDEIVPVEWDQIGTLLFTSGTTGASKAVRIPWYHLYLSSTRMWQSESLDATVRFYCPWPINHVTGAGAAYMTALLGGVLVLRERWSTSNFVADVTRYRCNLTDLMAEMVGYFENMTGLESTELTHIFVAPVTETVGPLLDRLGIVSCTTYNSTETNSAIGSVGYDPVPVGSCGRLRSGAEIRIVDQEGADVSQGDVGELLIRTDDPAAMNGGYWGMAEATDQAWRDGWFHTGDLLRIDADGYFYVAGRMKDRIRVRGENVNPDEIEAVISGRDDVAGCAAVGHPLPDGGDEIVLFVVDANGTFDEADARAFCDRTLPKFMRPARFIRIDELPMTPTGKVQRAELRALIQP